MEIEFHNKKIETLYTTGKSSKLKLDQQIVQSFFETVAILESAKDIHDLWNSPGLHFKKLPGYTNRYSARLSKKWRLEMSLDWQNEQMTVGIVGLEDISNHYGG